MYSHSVELLTRSSASVEDGIISAFEGGILGHSANA